MPHEWRSVPVGTPLGTEPESRLRILAAGVPYVAGASATDEAVELLAAAARIEHAMMVEYLRAAFSAKDARIRDVLVRIASDELCHLLTLQNLLLMLGAEPSLAREDHGSLAGLEPFPLLRHEFSLNTLARYVCCEAPPLNQVREEQRVTFAKARRAWSETAPFVNRAGALYAKLHWLLMEDDRSTDQWLDFPVDLLGQADAGRHVPEPGSPEAGRQLQPADWPGVLSCVTKGQARSAIFEIAGYGEGGPSRPASHFDRLLEAYTLAEGTALLASEDARAVPVEPTLDALYNLLSSELLLALTFEQGDAAAAGTRRALLELAFDDWSYLGSLARDGLCAAPAFELMTLTSEHRRALCDRFDEAITMLLRGLDALISAASTLRDSNWVLQLRRRVDARQAVALQVRAMS